MTAVPFKNGTDVDGTFLNAAEKAIKVGSVIMVGGKVQSTDKATIIKIEHIYKRGDAMEK